MPKLIDPSAQARPIPRMIGNVARMPDIQHSNAEAQGLVSLGRSIESGANEIFKAQKIEEERINTLRAEESFNKLRERQLDLTVGDDNGFVKQKGAAAVTRPLFRDWSQKFDDAETEIAGELTNDSQREKFKSRASVARLQYQEGILRHLAQEDDAYAKQVYDGVIATELQGASVRWDSPNDVSLSIERIKNAVDERAERYSWDAEYKNAVLSQEQGKVHAAVIGQAIATQNYKYAEQWYNDHREDIDPATSKQLAIAVENGTQKELTNGYNTRYLATENSMQGLESLRKEVLGDESLDENRKNVLVGRIQNRQYTLENRIQVLENKRLRIVERGLNEVNANTLAGYEATPEQMEPLLNAAKGTELEGEAQRAIHLANATRQFRQSPPLVQEQMLTQAETGLRTDPTKFDRRVVEAWRSIHENQRKDVQDSPVAFAVRQGFIEPPQPINLIEPEKSVVAIEQRFAIARSVANRYQAPIKPLTAEEVTLLKTTLERSNPEQKRDYLGKLFTASGRDMQGYMAMMAQLAPDDPVTAVAGSHAARGRGVSADLMLRGQQILRPGTKADGKPDGGLLPMPPDTDLRSGFDRYLRDTFAGKPEQRNAHYQASKAIYAALSSDAGDKDTKSLDSDRWEKSMELAIGVIDKHNGKRIVLPQGMDYGDFKDGVSDRVDAILKTSTTAGIRLSQAKTLPTDQAQAQLREIVNSGSYALDPSWTASRLRDLPLENVGDGRYMFRAGDSALVDLTGRPIIIDMNPPKGAIGMPP